MVMALKKNNPEAFLEKVWFVIIDSRQEGPYSLRDLKENPRFTPDTLVWKKGLKEWKLARDVDELSEAFEDETPSKALHEPDEKKPPHTQIGSENQATLTLQQDPHLIILWILVVLLIIIYMFYQYIE